jgi:AraC-like DNA-binding protein
VFLVGRLTTRLNKAPGAVQRHQKTLDRVALFANCSPIHLARGFRHIAKD